LTSGVTTDTTAVRPGSPRAAAAAALRDPAAVATAIVVVSAPAAGGTAAALLPWEHGTLLSRLLDQLDGLGIPDVRVLTRPAFEAPVRAIAGDRVHSSPDPATDLQAISAAAREPGAGLVVLPGDIVTQGEALAGLLKDPRVATGALLGGGWRSRQLAFRVNSRRGRVISAASPYHAAHKPTSAFLGVVKVAAADRPALAESAARLAELVAKPPSEWRDELARKENMWREAMYRSSATDSEEESDSEDEPAEDVEDAAPDEGLTAEQAGLDPEAEAWLQLRVIAAPEDTPALVLVGLVRSNVHVGVSRLRKLYWNRPLSEDAAREASERIHDHDEDKVLLDSAVKASDGFFTTFFVSPYSRYIARWCARRGFTPNQVTTVSLFIGLLAALGFATGERWGLVAGAILLQIAFTTDCVDGQLARYTRTFSKLGAWLDSIFDRSKEYLCFAGLAIGASRTGDPVWVLACCTLTMQTVRHFSDFSFGAGQTQVVSETEQPPLEQARDAAGAAVLERRANRAAAPPRVERVEPVEPVERPAPPKPSLPRRVLRLWTRFGRVRGVRWVKKMIAFPIGERFAATSITAALFDAQVTFIVLLTWGGIAAAYSLGGRILRSLR
jgi:CDP-alcohol phosphatidyltransferase/Family of unknown function (DUF5941)